jgi:hypothetical protein
MRIYVHVIAVFLAGMLSAGASEESKDLSGSELRKLISDSTVTGRHDTGMPYSEWHAPDGRVLGHNNRVANENACWDIKDNAVCYYYNGGVSKGVFCWAFSRVSDTGYRLRSLESGINATGLWQTGNPYDHSDNGKPWSCEPLSSHNMTPRPYNAPQERLRYARLSSLMKQR